MLAWIEREIAFDGTRIKRKRQIGREFRFSDVRTHSVAVVGVAHVGQKLLNLTPRIKSEYDFILLAF